ncbi:hypothetical protein ACOME3_000864 [Neoechinorhynchus agilis]
MPNFIRKLLGRIRSSSMRRADSRNCSAGLNGGHIKPTECTNEVKEDRISKWVEEQVKFSEALNEEKQNQAEADFSVNIIDTSLESNWKANMAMWPLSTSQMPDSEVEYSDQGNGMLSRGQTSLDSIPSARKYKWFKPAIHESSSSINEDCLIKSLLDRKIYDTSSSDRASSNLLDPMDQDHLSYRIRNCLKSELNEDKTNRVAANISKMLLQYYRISPRYI